MATRDPLLTNRRPGASHKIVTPSENAASSHHVLFVDTDPGSTIPNVKDRRFRTVPASRFVPGRLHFPIIAFEEQGPAMLTSYR
ncbi:MAG: hypothetical protein ACP5O0_10610 [Acidimicrobiales bacterium]